MNLINFFAGFLTVVGSVFILVSLFRAMTIQLHDESAALILRFGKLIQVLRRPGLHFCPSCVFPWVKVMYMSLQRDYREYFSISINDRNGTNVMVDLWLEFRIEKPEQALFEVEDWEMALKSLVVQSATSVLCSKSFQEILTSRNTMSEAMFNEIVPITNRWGIHVFTVMIKNVGLQTDVSRRILDSVSAKLERAKALIEEQGRIAIERLEAQTESEVAALNAEAKGQYSLAIGRAYHAMQADPQIFAHYKELYELSRLVPNRVVYFNGFSDEVRSVDAAMLVPTVQP